MRRRLLLALLLLLPQVGCAPRAGCQSGDACTRVLFIGNSYTEVNDLPMTEALLAATGNHHLDTQRLTTGGALLADHVKDPQTEQTLKGSHWDFVVIQEQSQTPSIEDSRQTQFNPAVRTLVDEIRAVGAVPILYNTWARRDGWPENGMATYESMQTQIDGGYLTIARELHVAIAPVGEAWDDITMHASDIVLWQDDGSHPTPSGTYLAACVMYATMFKASPEGLSFTDDLPDATATRLQKAAATTVLATPDHWMIS